MLRHPMPQQLNGFEIIGHLPISHSDAVSVILGHDSTRRYGKYLTAFVNLSTREPAPVEWYWGHYHEGLEDAMRDLVARAGLPERALDGSN